jgi:hypothetical protein
LLTAVVIQGRLARRFLGVLASRAPGAPAESEPELRVRDRKARAVGWEIERVSELDLSLRFDETIDDLMSSVGRRRDHVVLLQIAGRWPPR